MRLRLAHARWCTAFIVVIVMNVHVSLWVRRVHKTTLSSTSPPLYSDLERQLIARAGHNSGAQDLGGDIDDNAVVDTKMLAGPSLHVSDYTPHFNSGATTPAQKTLSTASLDAFNSTASGIIYGSSTRLAEDITRRRKNPVDYALQRTKLPSFASDESEYILSSMIERSSSSANLYLTTFMICHHILAPSVDSLYVHKVHPIMRETWRRTIVKFRNTQYHPSGARIQMANEEMFRCEIRHSSESKPYTVMGVLMPNRLTADKAANRLLDILRCPLMESQAAYRSFANSNGSIHMEIIRGNATIASFAVPWKSRQTGFLLSHSKAATTIDAWRGHELTMESAVEAIDKLHICIFFSSKEPTKSALPMYLEFVSHHLLLGASHINLPLPFGWNSKAMNSFTDIFQSHIDDGKLTLTSSSGDGIDRVISVSGLSFQKHALEIIQVNSCLYHSREMSEYLLVIDLDEFFMPKGNNWNFLDVLKSIETTGVVSDGAEKGSQTSGVSTNKVANNSHGWAVEHNHPACYVTVFIDTNE